MSFEVAQPIINGPFDEPSRYWYIREGETPELLGGRRPAMVFQPRNQRDDWPFEDGVLRKLTRYERGYELLLVNLVRERLAQWREAGYPGATRTTLDLLAHWRREGRAQRLFFAQLEAAETVIFLTEARSDFLQGVQVPREELSDEQQARGFTGFARYACKMATGAGKSTVMGMLAAWSILNKVNDRGDARFSDVVLIVCPNVTIRDRLRELDPESGDASLYRTRDLVPAHLMPQLARGRVLVTNWHVFQPQTPQGGGGNRVVRAGVPVTRDETVIIGERTTTARGNRYMTAAAFNALHSAGSIELLGVLEVGPDGAARKVRIRSTRWEESDTALVKRVLGRAVGGKQNILVMNDEAHHAYRILRDEPDEEELDEFADEEDAEEFFAEATVWVDGLDRIQKERGINFCLDLSATPYYLGRVGQQAARPFSWVVSDFGLIDAIESGLVKIPQLALRDTTGADRAAFFNIWQWMLETQMTRAERGEKRGSPKPEAVLKHAHLPITLMGASYEETRQVWANTTDDPRPPVIILVCKNTRIAATVFDWIANGNAPPGVPVSTLDSLHNGDGAVNTIRVDSKVIHETDTDGAKDDEKRWMRFTLDTVGRVAWPVDTQSRPVYPDGFAELAHKLGRPLSPPGRDVRCIVSVGMLTEGWDANTVTHIVGLRPFMSQLLCEQVVGRGLRRASYELDEQTGMFREEVAQVLGVPFEIIPFKATGGAPAPAPPKRFHVHALGDRAHLELHFPRVEGYTQAVRARVRVDWNSVPTLVLDPLHIPPETEMRGLFFNNEGRPTLSGPGGVSELTLAPYRVGQRLQRLQFALARDLARTFAAAADAPIPMHVLFPQLLQIVDRYVQEKVQADAPFDPMDALGIATFYEQAREQLLQAIHPDTDAGESAEVPLYERGRESGSTAEVDWWTSKDVRATTRSHLNWMVADTASWEQSAAYRIDRQKGVRAWVKNAGLGFTIPYLHAGQGHDYVPDFIVAFDDAPDEYLILEIKGYDPLADVKKAAAERWVRAVNADGRFGHWHYRIAWKPADVAQILSDPFTA